MHERDFLLWLAGFWDGEGMFGASRGMSRNGRSPKRYESFTALAKVVNTDKAIIDFIQAGIGFGSVYVRNQGHEKWKLSYHLDFNGRRAVVVAQLLLPYLLVKHRQAAILAAWPFKKKGFRKEGGAHLNGSERDEEGHEQQRQAWLALKELNHRGLSRVQAPHM